MHKEINDLFQKLGGKKIAFTLEIRVIIPGQSIKWIDDMYPVKDSLFFTISNHDDNYKIRLDMMNDHEQTALLTRLQKMVAPKEEVKPLPEKKRSKKAA